MQLAAVSHPLHLELWTRPVPWVAGLERERQTDIGRPATRTRRWHMYKQPVAYWTVEVTMSSVYMPAAINKVHAPAYRFVSCASCLPTLMCNRRSSPQSSWHMQCRQVRHAAQDHHWLSTALCVGHVRHVTTCMLNAPC